MCVHILPIPKHSSDLLNCVHTDVTQNIPDWKAYLMSKLVGANTLPVDFYIKVKLDCHSVGLRKIMTSAFFSRNHVHMLFPADRKHEALGQSRHARWGCGPQACESDASSQRYGSNWWSSAADVRRPKRCPWQRRLRFLVSHVESLGASDRLVVQGWSCH